MEEEEEVFGDPDERFPAIVTKEERKTQIRKANNNNPCFNFKRHLFFYVCPQSMCTKKEGKVSD